MTYMSEVGQVVYLSKDGKQTKTFDATKLSVKNGPSMRQSFP
jgi:hypothetical protein